MFSKQVKQMTETNCIQEILKVIHINNLIDQMQSAVKKLSKDKKRIIKNLTLKAQDQEKVLHK